MDFKNENEGRSRDFSTAFDAVELVKRGGNFSTSTEIALCTSLKFIKLKADVYSVLSLGIGLPFYYGVYEFENQHS